MKLKLIITGAIVCAALLFSVSPSLAQTASRDAYSHPSGRVQAQLGEGVNGSPDATVHKAATDKANAGLPFTGLDLLLVVGAGGALLALGFAMRRLTRDNLA
jgi:hypothetical protein